MEATIKMVGFGLCQYFGEHWNKFDIFVVAAGLAEAFMTELVTSTTDVNFSMLRILRVTRIVRLVRSQKGLRSLLATLLLSVPSLANVGSMLLLLFFVYAVMGMNLYGGASTAGNSFLTEDASFVNVPRAMLLLFRCSTGESWNGIMHDLSQGENSDNSASAVAFFFISFVVLCLFMMVNLFIAVILENFSDITSVENGDIVKQHHLESFAEVWGEVTAELESSLFCPSWELVTLLNQLEAPLGVKGDTSISGMSAKDYTTYMIDHVRQLRIKQNSAGQIFYLDTLHGICSSVIPQKAQEQVPAPSEALEPAPGFSAGGGDHHGHLTKAQLVEQEEHKRASKLEELAKKSVLKSWTKFNDSLAEQAKALFPNIIHSQDPLEMVVVDLVEEFNAAMLLQARWRLNKAKNGAAMPKFKHPERVASTLANFNLDAPRHQHRHHPTRSQLTL